MLRVKNLSFGYTSKAFLKNISFNIDKGENISLIGASGCGKSTLLQSLYGLHHVDGKIFWNDKQLLGPHYNLVPGEEFMKYLTQDFDLMPSLSAGDNIGKYLSNMFPRKKQRRINELLDLVEMRKFAKVKAKHLSGGQQQRIALARVLAKTPEILLLDEPFSHIDHFRKNKLRRNLFSYFKQNEITVIVATHDSTDALSFADRTFAMKSGKIISTGTPEDQFHNPKNAYVASLFGEVNEIQADLFVPEESARKRIVIYPHEIKLTDSRAFPAQVKQVFFKGSHYLVCVDYMGHELLIESPSKLKIESIIYFEISRELIQKRLR